jgi:hypothetical protein
MRKIRAYIEYFELKNEMIPKVHDPDISIPSGSEKWTTTFQRVGNKIKMVRRGDYVEML